MAYDYDNGPFAAYVTNLGKYNEGALVGDWVKFPTTYEEMQKVLEHIGIDGEHYEEWFITDYECHVEGIHDILGEYENPDELNYLAAKIEAMDQDEYDRFEAAIGISDYSRSVKDLINLTDNLDKYGIYPDVHSHDDLGRLFIDEYNSMEVPDHLKNYIDYEAYGRDIALDEIGEFTSQGYVYDTGDRFIEYYNGDRENIPEEYRIMSNPAETELAENEKPEQEISPLTPDDFLTGERISTPRGTFSLTEMTQEQMEAAGYGVHHDTNDGRFHTMGNGYQAFAIKNEEVPTYDIYQLKDTPSRRDYAFEPLDRLHEQGRVVDIQNYNKVYSSVMLPSENPESIYTRFNIDHPDDFTGHSLSISDVVVIHQNGRDFAHYCDRFGFSEVPEFLEQGNYLKNAEMAMEDDLGMIDGIINNGEKVVTPPNLDEKPSIRDRLAEAKRECSERKPPELKKPEKNSPENNL